MTLSSFKKRLKLSFVFIALVVYGLLTYNFGRSTVGTSKLLGGEGLLKVKGAFQAKNLDVPIGSPIPYSDTQSAQVLSSFVKLCANTVRSFEIAYPKDWFTTYNTDEQRCHFFAPYTFVVPQVVEDHFVPIMIESIKTEEWQSTVRFHENPNDFLSVVSVENVEINGRFAEEIRAISTGVGAAPKGFTIIKYLIFDSKNPLILSYSQQDAKEDTEKYAQDLEDMAKSLKFY